MTIYKGRKTKTFKGKRYRYEFELLRKSSAETYAKLLREEGKEATITYEGKVVGWVVWSRTPKGGRRRRTPISQKAPRITPKVGKLR